MSPQIRSSEEHISSEESSEVKQLKATIKQLTLEAQESKTFLYMVIHDLKHPLETMQSALTSLQKKLQSYLLELSEFVTL
jgi:light-regulated signal transduction histidine kinase (bacteriophytochrome)